MRFDIHILISTGEYPQYPYVATSNDTSRIIVLNEEHIGITEREDTLYFEDDYLPLSRSFEFDLAEIDAWIKAYTNQDEYSLITRFGEERHSTLIYHSPTNESPKSYDIFARYPEERARKLVEKLHPVMVAAAEMIRSSGI